MQNVTYIGRDMVIFRCLYCILDNVTGDHEEQISLAPCLFVLGRVNLIA